MEKSSVNYGDFDEKLCCFALFSHKILWYNLVIWTRKSINNAKYLRHNDVRMK